MPPPPRSRSGRDHRGGDPEARLRRTLESQQAASEASRAVLAAAAARRDADWRQAAELNRRRALTAVAAPLLFGVLLIALGALALPLLIAGLVVTLLWALLTVRIWRKPVSAVVRALGALPAADAVEQGLISRPEAERLLDVTEGLCAALGLPVPGITILEGQVPNALSFGRGPDDAVLILTVGVARVLDRIELEAVLAHELAHVKRRDVLTAKIAASGLGTAGDVLSGGRFTPFLLGDDREMRADLAAVSATRYPPGLISALEQIAALLSAPSSIASRAAGSAPGRRFETSWLVPAVTDPGRPGRRHQSELDDRLDVLREL